YRVFFSRFPCLPNAAAMAEAAECVADQAGECAVDRPAPCAGDPLVDSAAEVSREASTQVAVFAVASITKDSSAATSDFADSHAPSSIQVSTAASDTPTRTSITRIQITRSTHPPVTRTTA